MEVESLSISLSKSKDKSSNSIEAPVEPPLVTLDEKDLKDAFYKKKSWRNMGARERFLKILKIFLIVLAFCILMIIFFAGITLMSDAFKVLSGYNTRNIFEFASNPMAGLCVGILATVLFQSSSTTTSLSVALVASSVLSVKDAIPIVMGANVGTSVTNTLVSLGHIRKINEFRRAMQGGTVHDFFNIYAVLLFLPLNLIPIYKNKGWLELISYFIVLPLPKNSNDNTAEKLNFIKAMTTPMVDLIFEANNCLLHVVSVEGNNLNPKNFFKFCATACAKELCRSGYVYNPNDRNGCPRCFYKNRTLLLGGILKTSKLSDNQSAGIAIAIAIVLIMTTLFLLTKVMSFGLKEQTSSWIKKALLRHAIVGMLVGCLVTMLIQASGITTSSMVPLVALNVITLEQMFPVALGANVGTTITAFFAALGEGEPSGLQIAICHFLFNFFGILVFYPIPYMRSLPLESSRALGYQVSKNRIYGILFILVVFFVIPGALLGLSFAKGGVIVGAVLLYGTLLFVFVWRQIRVRRPQWIPLWCPNVMKPNHREEEEAKEEMYEAKKDFSDNKSLDAMVPTNDNGNGENWELEEGSLRKTNESV